MYGTIVDYTFVNEYETMAAILEDCNFETKPEWNDDSLLYDTTYRDSWSDEKRAEFYNANEPYGERLIEDDTGAHIPNMTCRWYTQTSANTMRTFYGETTETKYNNQKAKVLSKYVEAGRIKSEDMQELMRYLMPIPETTMTFKEMAFGNAIYKSLWQTLKATLDAVAWMKDNDSEVYNRYWDLVYKSELGNPYESQIGDTKSNFKTSLDNRLSSINVSGISVTASDYGNLEKWLFDSHYFFYDTPDGNLFQTQVEAFIAATN